MRNRTRLALSLVVLVLGAVPASAQPVGSKPGTGASLSLPGFTKGVIAGNPAPAPAAAESLIKANDKNGDAKLNADECPAPFRTSFANLDTNHDGYLDATELGSGLGLAGPKKPIRRGNVIANLVYTVADDFIVEIYQNGEKVSDSSREMTAETFGATDEKISIEVREGDWLVFNVVNNRLRWGGVSYFAVAGMKPDNSVGFVSDTTNGRWSYCDDPSKVNAFIADPAYLAGQTARPPSGKWERGDAQMHALTKGWKGSPVWGEARNTWIKFVAPPVESSVGLKLR